MTMMSIKDLFEHELKDMYFAEQHLEKALGTLEKESENEELKTAFAKHRKETAGHIKRLDQVFKAVSLKAQGK
jgi:ferritin-like metal-binding protein YciE